MSYAEIVRAHYFHEVDRRKDLDAGLAIPLGVLTAIFAALGTMFGSLVLPLSRLEVAVAVLGGGAAVFALISAAYLMRTFLGFLYKHPTSMKPLGDWRAEVISNGTSEEEADNQVEALMTEQYAVAADQNCTNNDRKAAYRYNSIFYAVISLSLVVASALPYLVKQVTEKPLQPVSAAATLDRI